MVSSLLLLAAVLATGVLTAPAPALDAFADAWSKIEAYSVTMAVHETAGNSVQDRTYALTFQKPSDATIVITKGPGRGGKVVWAGGDSVIGSPSGFLSRMKVHLGIGDARVTSLRGETAAMASFAWLLDHFERTPGVKTETPGVSVDGNATTTISLAVANPSADEGFTQEVLVIANARELPVSACSYIGADVVKDVHYSDVSVQTAGSPVLGTAASAVPAGH
jgi:outer membrane lipoprotein-sorting protein